MTMPCRYFQFRNVCNSNTQCTGGHKLSFFARMGSRHQIVVILIMNMFEYTPFASLNSTEDVIADLFPFGNNFEQLESVNPLPEIDNPGIQEAYQKPFTTPAVSVGKESAACNNETQLPKKQERTIEGSFAFCAVCAQPFDVNWNQATIFDGISFACPTCSETVFVLELQSHVCFVRQEDLQFAICLPCFHAYVAEPITADANQNRSTETPAEGPGPPETAGDKKEFGYFPPLDVETFGSYETPDEERRRPVPKKRGRKARCDVCEKTFENATQKKQHMRAAHMRAYRCDECGAQLKNAENLRRHGMCHKSNGAQRCPRCGARFAHLRSLKAHDKMCMVGRLKAIEPEAKHPSRAWKGNVCDVDNAAKQFPCPVCGKLFSVRPSVSRHIRIVHLELKPHECNICGKSFSSRYNLNVHLLKNHE